MLGAAALTGGGIAAYLAATFGRYLNLDSIFSKGGASSPADRAYPSFPETTLADLSRVSSIYNGASLPLTDISPVDPEYGLTEATELTTTGQTFRYLTGTSVLGTPVDVRDGSVALTFRPVAGLKTGTLLDRFDIELYSAGTPASPSSDFTHLSFGYEPASLRGRSTSPDNSTPGRWQRFVVPIQDFTTISGAGADLSSIIMARVVLRCSDGSSITIQLNKLSFVPNARQKAACILGFDDAYASHYTYAVPTAAAAGFKCTLFPSPLETVLGTSNHMTLAQLRECQDTYGAQIASQAWSTEDVATINAMTDAEREAEFAALRAYQKAQGLIGGYDGSYFSNVTQTDMTAYPQMRDAFRTLRTYYTGFDGSPPTGNTHRECWPFGDRHSIVAFSGSGSSTGSWGANTGARLTELVDLAIANKGVIFLVWHDELAGDGDYRAGFETLLSHLTDNSANIDVLTLSELIDG